MDDTKLLLSFTINYSTLARVLEKVLIPIYNDNCLMLNPDKTKLMAFKKRFSRASILQISPENRAGSVS